jgi:hypothetical protein
MYRGFVGLALGGLLTLILGCSGSSGPTVKGKVLLDGAPLAGAEVSLRPKSKDKLAEYVARTDDQGNFEIQSAKGRPVKTGSYQILITRWADKNDKVPSQEDYGQLKAEGKLQNTIPARYSDPDGSKFFAEIKEGENVLPPFEVSKKGK